MEKKKKIRIEIGDFQKERCWNAQKTKCRILFVFFFFSSLRQSTKGDDNFSIEQLTLDPIQNPEWYKINTLIFHDRMNQSSHNFPSALQHQ